MEMLERCRAVALAVLVASSTACHSAPSIEQSAAATEPVPSAKPVERGAVGDSDLRVMLTELASAKACELVRGQFRPLRAPDRPDVVTGIMWIRQCKVSNVGTKVTVALSGNGWQWAEQQEHKAGGSFAARARCVSVPRAVRSRSSRRS